MKEIYFKTEPAGEIGFGRLNENDIEVIKSLINSKEMKDSDYCLLYTSPSPRD